MASINNNIRGKKLFKEGTSGSFASKGSDGEITVSKEISDQLASLDDISSIFNDDALFQVNKFLVKQIEDLRSDVEELHGFIINAFGRDSSAAASQGARGATGSTGSAGAKGATGSAGATGGQGPKGDTGSAGTNGTNGSPGAKGATGSAGAKGDTGAAGATGGQGIQGIKGATGAAGSDASVKGASTNFTIGKTTYTFNNGLLEAVR
tara:strand:- start:3285 stop:3908 length:624 start_codon:yes stop_codon:yes gene_type:complete